MHHNGIYYPNGLMPAGYYDEDERTIFALRQYKHGMLEINFSVFRALHQKRTGRMIEIISLEEEGHPDSFLIIPHEFQHRPDLDEHRTYLTRQQ